MSPAKRGIQHKVSAVRIGGVGTPLDCMCVDVRENALVCHHNVRYRRGGFVAAVVIKEQCCCVSRIKDRMPDHCQNSHINHEVPQRDEIRVVAHI